MMEDHLECECSCGNKLSSRANFCGQCGRPRTLSTKDTGLCSCGKEFFLSSEQNFCIDCGSKLDMEYVYMEDGLARDTFRDNNARSDPEIQDEIQLATHDPAAVRACKYTVAAMLSVRTHEKNKGSPKATPAQRYFADLVRQAAQVARIWQNPPLMRCISDKQWEKFWSQLLCACPALSQCRHLVKERLREKLENRRRYMKSEKKQQVLTEKKEVATMVCRPKSHPVTSSCKSVAETLTSSTRSTSNADGFKNGDKCYIKMGEHTIGTGLVLRWEGIEGDGEGLFCEVVLHKKNTKLSISSEDINLPVQTESGATVFSELKEKEKFLWKKSRILRAREDTTPINTSVSKSSKSTCYNDNTNETIASSLKPAAPKQAKPAAPKQAKPATSSTTMINSSTKPAIQEQAKPATMASSTKPAVQQQKPTTMASSKCKDFEEEIEAGKKHRKRTGTTGTWEYVPADMEAPKAFEPAAGPREVKRKRLFDL